MSEIDDAGALADNVPGHERDMTFQELWRPGVLNILKRGQRIAQCVSCWRMIVSDDEYFRLCDVCAERYALDESWYAHSGVCLG